MKAGSVRLRIVAPSAVIVLSAMAVVLAGALSVSTRVSEDYEDFLFARHRSDIEQIVAAALEQLVSSGLQSRDDVSSAVRVATLRELREHLEHEGLGGAVLAQDRPLLSLLPEQLQPEILRAAAGGGMFHLYRGLRYVSGFVVPVPAFGWRVVVASAPGTMPLLRHNNGVVLVLVPLVAAASLLMLGGTLALLRRNLQRPLDAVVRAVAGGEHVPATGVLEVDAIGAAVNAAVEALRLRNRQLDLLQQIALSLSQVRSHDEILALLLERSAALIGASYAAIGILHPDREGLQRLLRSGASTGDVPVRELCSRVYGRIRNGMRPVRLNDPATDPSWTQLCSQCCTQFANVLAYPAPSRRGYADVVLFFANKSGSFTAEDEDLAAAIAAHALTAIERQQASEQLRRSEEHYRTLAEESQDLIFETDPAGRLLYINRYAAHFFLAEPAALAGRAVAELLPAPTDALVRRDLQGVVRSGRPAAAGWPVSFPSRELWWDTRLIPLLGPDGSVASVVAIGRDLTERRRTEQALEAEKERLAVTLRSIGEGVVTCDTAGRVVLVNRAAEAIAGTTQELARGRPFGEAFALADPAASRSLAEAVRHLVGQGWAAALPLRGALPGCDGRPRTVEFGGAPIRDADSRVVGAVLVLRDLTEEQRREEEIQRAQRLESLGLLAGGIAHDFNNILTGILGNATLAATYAAGEPRLARPLEEVEKAALRAGALTRQLLTFSRGGAPVKAVFNLGALLREAGEFALHGSPIALEFSIPADLWWVEADEGQIGQVLNNLVVNAVQAMPGAGTITVAAENLLVAPGDQPLAPGRHVRVTVADTGCGIAPAALARIFDPYFTTKPSGTGLGLATSYSIVQRHGGRFDVVSTPGSGSAFSFTLPAVARREEARDAAAAPVRGGRGRVLVMDDEQIIRDLAREALAALGYDPLCVCTGEEAVRAYREARDAGAPFATVIMDLTIPGGMGGKEAVRVLRGLDPGVRAVVSSGYSNDPVMANYREFGFAAALAKPFRVEDLAAVVHRPA
jgi:PAS domain S-box-containing protein